MTIVSELSQAKFLMVFVIHLLPAENENIYIFFAATTIGSVFNNSALFKNIEKCFLLMPRCTIVTDLIKIK